MLKEADFFFLEILITPKNKKNIQRASQQNQGTIEKKRHL
jgi:hypothetical protein